MSYYNIIEQCEYSKLPDEYAGTRPYQSATHRHYSDGWREVIPFVAPDGYVISGNRRIEVVNDEAHEVFDVITEAEAQAQNTEANRARWEAENAFLTAVQTVNVAFNLNITASDGFQEVLEKLKASESGTQLDRLQAGVELRTLWDVCEYHGSVWGQVVWHEEVVE